MITELEPQEVMVEDWLTLSNATMNQMLLEFVAELVGYDTENQKHGRSPILLISVRDRGVCEVSWRAIGYRTKS